MFCIDSEPGNGYSYCHLQIKYENRKIGKFHERAPYKRKPQGVCLSDLEMIMGLEEGSKNTARK